MEEDDKVSIFVSDLEEHLKRGGVFPGEYNISLQELLGFKGPSMVMC